MHTEELFAGTGQPLQGPLLLHPRVFGDERGFFFESWNRNQWLRLLTENGQQPVDLVQDNHSSSSHSVLRGLHYQLPPHAQGKLVRCVVGEIFDAIVDVRHSSLTFLQSAGVRLSAENKKQLWVPPGFAHGFLVLSETAEVLYKTSDFWSQASERAIRWDDPQLQVAWPLDALAGVTPQLSKKDAQAPLLTELSAGDLFP